MGGGPLAGVRVVELGGIGPGPFAAMMLADMGADVVRVERAQAVRDERPAARPADPMLRGRRSVALDLKHPDGLEALLALVDRADALIEGFRPGVMERLGAGPDACLARNPRLVYGRMTGWGQDGPLSQRAGHDIDYIALAGALAHFGRAGAPPTPPLNMVGDFGGGGMLLAFGVVCALLEARRSGAGQVIDAAMVDGTAALMSMFWGMAHSGLFDQDRRGENLLDTGAPFYDVYECRDGGWVAVGALEPQFFAELLRVTGLADDPAFVADDGAGGRRSLQGSRAHWPAQRARLAEVFAGRTRDEWARATEGTDACVAPVLAMREAAAHPHLAARRTYVEVAGVTQPAPAPRYSRSAAAVPAPPAHPGEHTRDVLTDWAGVDPARVDAWLRSGAARQG
ncbi:MAG: CaiB/BaiF CoA transferase family protein [Acidimicrobiia bacterium]